MSFVKNFFGSSDSKETEDEEDMSEETSDTSTDDASSDTGFFSPGNSNSDLDNRVDGIPLQVETLQADCSTISNFFGYCFFRKSKKDNDKKKESSPQAHQKETAGSVQGKDVGKNTLQSAIQKAEIAYQSAESNPMPNYSSECELRKNVPNASSLVETLSEKNETKSEPAAFFVSPDPDIIATMCDPSGNTFKKPDVSQRRGSCVKPCGHGTTAISPRVPVLSGSLSNHSSPGASPVLEIRRQFRIKGIEKVTNAQGEPNWKNPKAKDDTTDTDTDNESVTASMKLHVNLPKTNGLDEDQMKNLINQEAKFQSQLNELSKQLSVRDAEANKLKFQMEELQRDVFAKSAGMDRLEAELNAARKECELIRQRIRILEEDLETYRKRNSLLIDELEEKSELLSNYEKDTKTRIEELEGIVKDLQQKIEELEQQLNTLSEEKIKLDERRAELIAERDEEKKKVAETLEQAIKQKQEIEKKWKEDFEKLRTINILKEQQLLDDFEWKLREVQQNCKKRLEDKDKDVEERLQDAYRQAEMKMKEAEAMMDKLESLKSYESEVEQLRHRTVNQEKTMRQLLEQQDQMKQAEESLRNETRKLRTLIDMEKENLQHMQHVHHQEILDKERKLKQTLDEKRTEIAMYWEDKLLTECARLKYELEQIHTEEKWMAMESVRKTKDENFQKAQKEWEKKLKDCLKEVTTLKRSLIEKDEYYREELIEQQTATDRDILELRRLMDKIDMSHHNKYEKLVLEHDNELEKINEEHEKKIQDVENYWKDQVTTLRDSLEKVKEQMEEEAQQRVETMIQQHRDELNEQWDNLIHQKGEAMQLLEEEYVNKYKTLDEQCQIQQKSHSQREVELLKTIDKLKNELQAKESTIDDLQNNVDTLEGGVQVLNHEIAQQVEDLAKTRKESDQKIKGLLGTIAQITEKHEKENEAYRLKLMSNQKQSHETIDHLQRKCQCLTKLFEEVRQRYERRESRQEDITTISDLRQIIAEQEKDLACINEEKRYFQMRLMALEKHFENNASAEEEEEFEDAHGQSARSSKEPSPEFVHSPNGFSQSLFNPQNGPICIPPTIPECDDCDE